MLTNTRSRTGLNMNRLGAAYLGIVLLGLAGCGDGGVLGTGIGAGSFRAAARNSSDEDGPLTTARNFLLYGGASVPAPAGIKPGDRVIECPKISVLEGTAAMRIGLASGGATEVAHQASLGRTERECAIEGDKVAIKVGVEGRLLIGVLGKPGTYVVPVRVAVKREKVVLYSNLVRLNVTVPAGETQASFTHIEEGIRLPLTEHDPGDEYDILVGFDPQGKADLGDKKKEPGRKK